MRWIACIGVVGVLVAYQEGSQRAAGQAIPDCNTFSTGDKGCGGCTDSPCGTCVGGACEPEEMTECFKEFNVTQVAYPDGYTKVSWERPCGGVFYCVFDPPCNGQACYKGMSKEAVPGTFDTWRKGTKCKEIEPGEPGG